MAKKFSMDWNKINEKIKESESKGSFEKDQRIYTLKAKDDGSASAIIRFIPQNDLSKVPFVKLYNHGFKNGGQWFINNCPTTINKPCPVCKANSDLWDSDPETVRSRSRKTSYYTNILIIKDPQKPENEGKVFIYRFGKKIFDKIMNAWHPPEGSVDDPIEVFDYYAGSNFKLIMKSTKNGPNYDDSKFVETITEVGDDDTIEKIHSQTYNIDEFISADKFKTYEELENRFNEVVGLKSTIESKSPEISNSPDPTEDKVELKLDESRESFLSKLKKKAKE